MTQLDEPLQQTLDALDRLVTAPATNGSLRGLQATIGTVAPQARFLGPYITVCNYWHYFWTCRGEHFSSDPDAHRQLAARAAEHGPRRAGHRRGRRVRGQRVRARPGHTARHRAPGPPRRCSTAPPSTRRAARTAAPARPATDGRQPVPRRVVPATRTAARPSTGRRQTARLGRLQAARPQRQGVGLGPRASPTARPSPTAPGGHGVDVPRAASRDAPRAQGRGGRARSAWAC